MTRSFPRALPLLTAAVLFFPGARAQTEGEFGLSAPSEAYEPGNPLPYFGSENPWNRRMFGERPADLFYKRRGQRQLLAILDGNPAQAATWARQRIERDARDAESWFMLTIAMAQTGKIEAAVEAMEGALQAGLPFERFVAGPRDLLFPLTETPAYRRLAKALDVRLLHGPMLGDITHDAASVWVRTAAEGAVTVVAVPLDAPHAAVKTRFDTDGAEDFTGRGRLAGLHPDTTYVYRLSINGVPVTGPAEQVFRTRPSPGTASRFSVAIGGCAGYTPANEHIWQAILRSRPAALLLLGDNVYIDVPGVPGAFHQYTYYRRQSRPDFRQLVGSTPVYAIWDDHDVAIDDCFMGPYPDRPAWKIPNFQFFARQWNNPPMGDRDNRGVWSRFSIGDVDFFLLDGRNYRTNPFAEEKTMLGPVQKKWLLEGLAASRATFKVIASPVAWSFDSKEGSLDTWSGFPKERAEIFDLIRDRGISGVVLASSDRHRSDVWRIEHPGGYTFYEFGSGMLTNIHTHDTAPKALFSYNEKNSFQMLHFDTTLEDPTLTVRTLSIDGEIVHEITVPLGRLGGRPDVSEARKPEAE